MKKIIISLAAILCIASCGKGGQFADVAGLKPDEIRLLQPGGSAEINLYIPKTNNGKMVIICPSGGNGILSDRSEGACAARWLYHYGIASCVLFSPDSQSPLTDVQNTLKYCRSRADELGISKVGLLGMSAGGGLVAEASTLYTAPDTKPDFQILLYPLMTSDVHVTKDAPDALIIRSNLDSVIGGETSYDYYAELCHKKANVEIDVYPEGCHGWGFADPRLMTRRELRKAGDFEEQLPNTREEVYSTLERWLGVRPARVEGIADKIDGPDQVLMLYPNGQDAPDGLPGAEGPLESNGLTGPEVIEEWGMVTPGSGDNAKIELYFPEKPNGQLVIICPGGGYRNLNGLFCGTLAGNFFKSNGITCCILKYRMPNGHKMVPLQDVWNTMRYCRHMADEWGIKQVGVMGSSAGGHLAAVAATLYKDAVTRPDFSILLYPVTTFNTSITHGGTRLKYLGKDMTEEDIREFSAELHVTPDTPPTYFACSRHDRAVPCENFTVYQKALYNNNVPAEAHVYFEGTHGWAFGSPYYLNALTRNNQGIYCLDEKPGKVYGDDLHGCRQDFETSLLRWLGSLR